MITLRNIFHRRQMVNGQCSMFNERLTIDGIGRAPLTPEPDDAELAAAALMESLASEKFKIKNSKLKAATELPLKGAGRSYYHALAEKIKAAHEQERRAAMRFVAFAEGELSHKAHEPHEPHKLAELEAGLFKHQDTVERDGGDLLRRWQHCLANITLMQFQFASNETKISLEQK